MKDKQTRIRLLEGKLKEGLCEIKQLEFECDSVQASDGQ